MPDNHVADVAGIDFAGFDAAVVAEQVRLLIHKRVDLPINLLNASIVTATLWPLYPFWLLAPWLGLFYIVVLIRHLIRRHYQSEESGPEMALRWGRIFTLNAFGTACLWGLTGSVILMTSNPIYHIFIVFVLGGMMAGGIVGNSAYMPTMVAFTLPTIVPVILILVSRHDVIQIEMGVMLTAFAAVVINAGRNINRSIIDNFRLRIGQDFLLIKLGASKVAMANSQAIAHVGSWEFDERTKVTTWTEETYRIFGVDPGLFKPSYETVMARIHPLDRGIAGQGLARLINDRTDHAFDHRIVMNNGTIKYVHVIIQAKRDGDGNVQTLIGTVQNITERKRAADALAYRERLLHAVTIGTGILVKAESLDQGMPDALRILGEALHVDRVIVMQETVGEVASGALPTLRYIWQVNDIQIPVDASAFELSPTDIAAVAAWQPR